MLLMFMLAYVNEFNDLSWSISDFGRFALAESALDCTGLGGDYGYVNASAGIIGTRVLLQGA